MSLPQIPSPLKDNSTLPFPLDSTAAPPLNSTDGTPTPPLLPYQNKTLGELVDAILNHPVMLEAPEPVVVDGTDTEGSSALTPVPPDSSDDAPAATNPLQNIAGALPWLAMGHGPVVASGLPEAPL
ncbi:hypothetical protein B5807_04872 [Epicoccum nigrum]|uniref:Uncharacterized protein n=1 Tax=Epicoccum nigrum TaxID=105696 RepID=A0A1Y2M5G4_EPING|nr:hypothetical protein B5807_04872 [Epicoccum nigrum]